MIPAGLAIALIRETGPLVTALLVSGRVGAGIGAELGAMNVTEQIDALETEGLVGGIFLSIATGSDEVPVVPEKGTIPSREPFALADLLEQASETIEQVNATVEKVSDDLETTIQQVELATRDAHQLFIDITPQIKSIAENGSRISADTQQVMANVRQVSEEARRAIADVRSEEGPAQGMFADVRVTLGQAREVTANMADVTEAMKHNKHLPANPLVIEGYATAGTVGERYRLSRQRAGIVREYVLSRFGLMPQHTGYIALAADAVDSPSGDEWDGVALTLFVDLEQLQFAPQPRSAGLPSVRGSGPTGSN